MGSQGSKEEKSSRRKNSQDSRSKQVTRSDSEYDSHPDGIVSASFTETESSSKGPHHNHSANASPPPIARKKAASQTQDQTGKDDDNPNGSNGDANHRTATADNKSSLISSFVNDDEVKVNLAMADLMAYLQVVANNSANLPLTRRDDPELPKTVSSLTADEYSRKSAAFIPADVRVIAGSFTKYGRVWDLPSSEEFNAVDGAHEPGRSYGGACANAMLKVLYDAANESNALENGAPGANDSLFDDDDEESLISSYGVHGLSRDRTFQSLTLGDVATQSTLTWATLLRKMKAEIAEIEYAQAPTITSTRKFDLNQPFTLIPAGFDETVNKKRSLLIGCNYGNVHGAELKASHDDIRSIKDYIVNVHGFSETKGYMTVLLDDDSHKHPTHLNITEGFKALSELSQPGDAVFVHFSGHGGRVLDDESYDEVIVPSDFQTSGIIRDTLIFKTLLAPMRYGVTVTILIDCCDTGMVFDLPYSWTTKTDRIETEAKLTLNDDFSFVRFLKVVKTLYDASTFTQLGRTVGSALHTNGNEDDDYPTDAAETMDDETTKSNLGGAQEGGAQTSFLSAFGACNNGDCAGVKNKTNDNKTRSTHDGESPSTPSKKHNFFEKVLNCTLIGDDDGSDDDTYTRDGDMEATTTFETEDESYQPRRRRRR
ncbi:Caspase domain [Fragilaria crotonensis]|nr:Caspase domain [Fragilaria crotonensis]